jgi:hypothetical protein
LMKERSRNLAGTSLALATEQHDRGRTRIRRRQQLAEVRVPVDQDATGHCGSLEHRAVGNRAQADVSRVDDIVTCSSEQLGQAWRLVLVEEELHAGRRSGSSRFCTASHVSLPTQRDGTSLVSILMTVDGERQPPEGRHQSLVTFHLAELPEQAQTRNRCRPTRLGVGTLERRGRAGKCDRRQ